MGRYPAAVTTAYSGRSGARGRCWLSPPRAHPRTWPATERGGDELLATLLAPPFTVDDHGPRDRRRRGLIGVLSWLSDQPGDTWQQRWLASGADALGNADWWRPVLSRL